MNGLTGIIHTQPLRPVQHAGNVRPPMDAMCVCGTRYGEHRVNDFRCRNPKWSCGNGEPQWGESVFARAAS